MQREYNITNGQAFSDICLAVYGTLDHYFKLAQDNMLAYSASGNPYDAVKSVVFDDTIIDNQRNLQRDGNIRYSTSYTLEQ